MNESINTRKYTQKLWNKVKDTFLTKEYAIKGALVGQEWTLFESTVGNSPIVLPPSDSFIELYIEMYSSNNGTITHQKTMRMDSILFESDNMEYREIVLDSMYNAQTYVRYDFATNSIIPTVYEGDEITDSSSDIITTIYTKTNKIEAGSIEAEKIVIDNTTNNLNATNMQGALNEVVDKLNNLSDGNPQDITKEDIGLGNVDNTSDLDKPVSTAQQTAIDNAVTESKGYTDTKVADLVGSAPETLNALEEIVQAIEENEDVVTALNSAIGTKANQSDLDELSNIVDTKASQDDLTELQNTVNENIGIQLSEHTSNTSNPHGVTASQLGLDNVDNTSDLDKPVSTATQTAIDNSLSESKDYTDTKVANLVGTVPETLNTLEKVAQAIEDNGDAIETLNGTIESKANQSDLEALSNTVDTKASQDDLAELQSTVNENIGVQLSTHTSNTSNPHGVTASQLGLDNVDNTSDLDKPVSTPQQEAINNSLYESKDYTDTKVAELIGDVIGDDGTELADTLLSGQTTITFTSEEITNDSKLNAVYTSIFDVPLESATFEDGTLTLVFPAQEEDMTVVALINATSFGDDIVAREVMDELDDVQDALDEVNDGVKILKDTVGYSKKQLFENKAVTRTLYGVTHTHNSDGTIISNGTNTSTSMSIITLTGTADNEYVQIDNLKDGEKYILNGCPSGGGEEIYSIRLIAYDPNDNNKWVKNYIDYGEGVEFTYNASLVYRFYISVSGGVTVTNLTFKPMIRYASIEDDTFEQYIEDVDTRLDNVENAVTDTVLPRYKKINLSSSGWYRIAKMECRSESEANGSGNNSCDIEIKRMYNTISPEYKKIKLVSLYENSSFVDEISKSATDNANTITKIRHTVDTTNNTSYIEVYYKANSENNMFITLNNHFNGYVLAWKLITPIATSETVNNVTILGSHEFSLNGYYTYTIDFDSQYITNVMLNAVIKKNGWAICKFQFKLTSNVKADTQYNIATLPNELIPLGSNNVFAMLDSGMNRDNSIYAELYLNQTLSNIVLIVRNTPNTNRWYHATFSYPLLND